jgi:gas vesicle protein
MITTQKNEFMEAKNLIGGIIVGAAVGITAGLLLAPRSGERTKKKLVKGTMKLKRDVVSYVDGSIEDLRSQFNDKIDQLAKRSKETINHVSERVKV